MRELKVQTDKGLSVASRVRWSTTLLERAIGLLSHRCLTADEGMLLMPCRSIHTIGMRFPIDVVFLDSRLRITRIASDVAPGRLRWAPRGTHCVLEVTSGRARAVDLGPGQQLVCTTR